MSANTTNVSDQKRSARALQAVLGRAIYARGLSALRGVVILPLITPGELGLFRYVMTLQSYTVFLALGATTALGVEYPVKDAAGDQAACRKLTAMAYASTASGTALALVYLLVVFFHNHVDVPWITVLLAVMGCGAVLQNYLAIAFRVEKRFSTLARNDAIVDTFCFVGALAGAYWFGVRGLLIATLASPVIALVLGARYLSPGILRHLDTSNLGARLKTNLTYLVTSSLSRVVTTVDLVLLGSLLGTRDPRFGAYSLGTMCANLITLVINALSQVQLVQILGEHGKNKAEGGHRTLALLEEVVLRDSLLSMLLAAAVGSGTDIAIHLFAPQHAAVVPYLGIFVAGAVVVRWRDYSVAIMYATERLRFNNFISLASIASIVVAIGVVYFFFDSSLLGFCMAPLCGYGISGIVSLLAGQRQLIGAQRSPFVPRLLLAHLPLAGMACGFYLLDTIVLRVGATLGSLLAFALLVRVVFPSAFDKAFATWLGRRSKGDDAG